MIWSDCRVFTHRVFTHHVFTYHVFTQFGGGVDPWLYHHVGGLRPPNAAGPPHLQLGVECVVMQVRKRIVSSFATPF
jgi:hypothetical protein